MKTYLLFSTVCALLLALGTSALAQFCPVCGTNPCRVVAQQKGIKFIEPPSPRLSPADTVQAATVGNRLLNAAEKGIKDLKDEAYLKLFNARPVALLNTIDQLSQSHEELKNPTTVESWARAVQVEALLGIIKEVYVGALGTVSNVGAKIVSQTYSASAPIVQTGTPSKSRTEQFFGLLDALTAPATGNPAPPKCGPEEAFGLSINPACTDPLCFAEVHADMQVDAEVRAVREKLLLAMMTGYNDAGLYYQSLELRRLAEQRWGAAANPQFRPKIDVENQRAVTATASEFYQDIATKVVNDEVQDPELTNKLLALDAGSSGVINFRVSPQKAAPGVGECFYIKCTLLDQKNSTNNVTPANSLLIKIYDLHSDAISVKVNNLEIPVSVVNNNNHGGYNAVKIRFEESMSPLNKNEGLVNTLTISVNGQQVATHVLPVPSYTVLKFPSGKPMKFTRQYRLIPYVDGGVKGIYQYNVEQ
jgi:hypothetical protein